MRTAASIVSAMMLAGGVAFAAGTPAQKCQSGKNQTVGKYIACRSKAEAKLASSGDALAYGQRIAKCAAKYTAKWPSLEESALDAGSSCPSEGDQTLIQDFTDACSDAIATALAGGLLPPDVATCNSCPPDLATCNGNNAACAASLSSCTTNLTSCSASLAPCTSGTATAADVLAGKTFSSGAGLGSGGTAYRAPLLKTGQTNCYNSGGGVIACAGTGQDGDLLKGVARSYTDNGDGTITDNKTGLIWEKLDDNNAGGIHDMDNPYTWLEGFKRIQVLNGNVAGCIAGNIPDSCCTGAGTGSCSAFAGFTDWRVPNILEQYYLFDFGRSPMRVDPVFHTNCTAGCTVASCSCTGVNNVYISSTTGEPSSRAFYVASSAAGFTSQNASKTHENYRIRAVRGGI